MSTWTLSILLPQLLQVAPIAVSQDSVPPVSRAQSRLEACILLALTDATSALAEAALWQEGSTGTDLSYALQCQGQALVFLLRWRAAADAFLAARDARPAEAHAPRARLGTMAGNALFAAGDHGSALNLLDTARTDAIASGDGTLAGGIDVDRARPLVALGRDSEAEYALQQARQSAPQNPEAWLLSATLARRQGRLAQAESWIGTALALDPANGEMLLESGLIFALLGRDGRARENWRALIALSPDSQNAATARDYLRQLDDTR